MSVQDFVPSVWSARILKQFDKVHTAKKMTNSDYEGEVGEYGSSVKISMMGDIAVSDYVRNTDLAAPEELDMSGEFLTITQGKTIHFFVDDLDKRQARGEFVSRASQRATYALSNVTDFYLFTVWADEVPSANTITTDTIGLGAGEVNVLNILAQGQVLLDENNVPEDGRIAYLPPFAETMLRLDERYTGFNTPGASGPLRGQPIGRAMGFTIFKSNNLPRSGAATTIPTTASTGTYQIFMGHPDACTFAEQVDKMTAYSPERRFGDAIKGLHVYGAKVVRPEALVTFKATRGSFV